MKASRSHPGANYYSPTKGKIVNQSEFVSVFGEFIDREKLPELGYFPFVYEKPEYEEDIEELVPETTIVLVDNVYTQRYRAEPRPDNILEDVLKRWVRISVEDMHRKADEAMESACKMSEAEKLLYNRQRMEILDLTDNPDAFTHTLDELAKVRGVSRQRMIEDVTKSLLRIDKAAIFITGKLYAYEDEVIAIAKDTSIPLIDRIKKLKQMEFSYTKE